MKKLNACVQFSAELTTKEHTAFLRELDERGSLLTRKQAEVLAKKYQSKIWLEDDTHTRVYQVLHTGESYPC